MANPCASPDPTECVVLDSLPIEMLEHVVYCVMFCTVLMLAGVFSAVLAVLAKQAGDASTGSVDASAAKNEALGVAACVVSVLAAAVNMVLAGALSSAYGLNSMDTTVYMSSP